MSYSMKQRCVIVVLLTIAVVRRVQSVVGIVQRYSASESAVWNCKEWSEWLVALSYHLTTSEVY